VGTQKRDSSAVPNVAEFAAFPVETTKCNGMILRCGNWARKCRKGKCTRHTLCTTRRAPLKGRTVAAHFETVTWYPLWQTNSSQQCDNLVINGRQRHHLILHKPDEVRLRRRSILLGRVAFPLEYCLAEGPPFQTPDLRSNYWVA